VSETFPFIEHFPYLGVFLLLILGTIGFPFPEDTILMLCGFLITQGVIRPVPIFLIVYPTLLLTDLVLYWSGRRYGRRVIEHRRFQRILSPERLRNIEEQFNRWGSLVIFFSAPRFLLADALSSLITLAVMGGIGYFGGSQIHMVMGNVARINRTLIISLVSLLLCWFLFRRFRSDKVRMQSKDKG
jgi:membrane protein DedA with SNARE-associated domain